ncbi:glycosyltransferase family 90 protein [Westerdykella ornata]|uniref:Glycosyltransferase family 90 protein n=1 Tax=Westerdykella ornata TaxID=318751 RepID=A0A6A6JPL4_WESOR|nr:glycosyltransferase family 90 protein [Westerdykella ornata]KAF2278195.1 glycosyltransferase family 90 protein [Westerdykella ornata]
MRDRFLWLLLSAALAVSHLSAYISNGYVELCSDLLSWVLIPCALKGRHQCRWRSSGSDVFSEQGREQEPTALALWTLALGISISAYYTSQIGTISLYPLLGPVLLLNLRNDSPAFDDQNPSPLRRSRWLAMASGCFVAGIFLWDESISGASKLLSIIPVGFQLLGYTLLLPRGMLSWNFHSHITNLEDVCTQLAWRNIITLAFLIGLEAMRSGVLIESATNCLTTVFLGTLKAVNWFLIAGSATLSCWTIAPFILTTASVFAYTVSRPRPLFQGMLLAIGHCLFLQQTLHRFSNFKRKFSLWAFAALCFYMVLTSHWKIASEKIDAIRTYRNFHDYPVELLAEKAEKQFHELIRRQSKTYHTAYDTYLAKHKIKPPPEFESWFDFANLHASPIIDDFHALYDSLAPFWKLSGQEVLDGMKTAYAQQDSELWLCEFKKATGKTSCSHAWRQGDRHISLLFNKLLANTTGRIPDVNFLVNHLDEPRVMFPQGTHSGQVRTTDLSHQNTWDVLTSQCTGDHKESFTDKTNIETYGLPFVVSRNLSMDLCRHPEYRGIHGIFTSPPTFNLITGTVPVLSTGSLSTMGDIIMPSPAYIEEQFLYDEGEDIDWGSKRNQVYWAGSTTGGYAEQTFWFHRQRFVALAQNALKMKHKYLRARNGIISLIESSFLNTLFFDVAFTRISQCQRPYCGLQKSWFRTKPWADSHHSLKSRFVFDLDGNGISGRYYQLLASKSAPLKMTILREWHDDRLVPWVHYIPVSPTLEDLPELISYFMWSKSGQRLAYKIAGRGREWKSQALREEDMAVYLYRLLIELARLQDPDRQAMT